MNNQDKIRNRLIAGLFAAGITVTGAFTVFNAVSSGILTGRGDGDGAISAFDLPDVIDESINEAVPGRYSLVNVNGFFQKLIGKREIDDAEADVYMMNNGQLIYGADCLTDQIPAFADSTAELSDELKAKGIPLMYVQLPYKIENGANLMPAGTQEYANANANELVAALRDRNVLTVDLRDSSDEAVEFARGLDSGVDDYEDLFYNTDQHWTNETALWAAGQVSIGLKGKANHLTADQFSVTKYEDKFLGSFGKKTGSWYGGIDDYDLILPKYATDLEFTIKSRDGDIVRKGSFEDAMLDKSNLSDELFECNTYETYTGGNYAYTVAKNNKLGKKGPKILLIRDSFSCAMMPFLALECGELTAIDLRYLKSMSALDFVNEGDFDAVVIAYNPTMFGENTFTFK